MLALVLLGTLTLGLGACGDDGDRSEQSDDRAIAAADAARLKTCGLPERTAALPDGLVPDGLLASDSIVLGAEGDREARVLVPGRLRDAFQQLVTAAAKAGATVQAQEIETLDAEIELDGPTGEIELRLEPAPSCGDGTVVRVERR